MTLYKEELEFRKKKNLKLQEKVEVRIRKTL